MNRKERKEKQNRKKLKIFIAILLIIISIIIITVISTKDKSNTPSDNEGITLYDTKLAEYVKETDNGTKINTSAQINTNKKIGELDATNIQLTESSGITTLVATVANNTSNSTGLTNIKAIFLDEKGNELYSARGIVSALNVGETTTLNISISSSYITAYDVKFEILKNEQCFLEQGIKKVAKNLLKDSLF